MIFALSVLVLKARKSSDAKKSFSSFCTPPEVAPAIPAKQTIEEKGIPSQISKIASVLIIILGIISFALGGFSIDQPLFAAVLIGVALIIKGVGLYME